MARRAGYLLGMVTMALAGGSRPLLASEKAKGLSTEETAKAIEGLCEPDYPARYAASGRLFSAGVSEAPALVEALQKAEAALPPLRMPALALLAEAYGGHPRIVELRHLLTRITGHASRDAAGWTAWLEQNRDKDRKTLLGKDLELAAKQVQSKDADVRRAALQVFARIGDAKHLPGIVPLLRDKEARVQKAACRAIAEIAQAKTADALKGLFNAKDPWLRREALTAASRLLVGDVKPALKAAVGEAQPSPERAQAVLDLARFGDPTALQEAAGGLGDRAQQNFQLLYCEALSQFPKDKVTEALRKALGAPKTDHPILVAAALGALGDRASETLKPIEAALKASSSVPDADARTLARQNRLLAARVVADAFPEQTALRALANDAFRGFASDVDSAVERGVAALRELQERQKKDAVGSWELKIDGWKNAYPSFQQGACALALLALHKSGVPKDDPDFVQGLRFVLDCEARAKNAWQPLVYSRAMTAILLSEVDPETHREHVKRIVDWLRAGQLTAKPDPAREGQWNYFGDQSGFQSTNSVTQFALMGVFFASHDLKGLDVPDDFWKGCGDYWFKRQRGDRGWGYDRVPNLGESYGNMTAAGAIGLLVCQAGLLGDRFRDLDVDADPAIRDALDWMAEHFDDEKVPELEHSRTGWGGFNARYYWFYSVERLALLLGSEYIGNRHWHHDIASRLLECQSSTGGWSDGGHRNDGEVPAVSTAFALLFLKRAPLPVQIKPPNPYVVGDAP